MSGTIKRICGVVEFVFGWGVFASLFGGGLTFVGYVVALIAGGEAAQVICRFIFKTVYPVLIYISTASVVAGLMKMYLNGETALSAKS